MERAEHAPRSKQQTTPYATHLSKKLKITHPYHPHSGQEVEIIRKCHGENILVETAEGDREVVVMSWADHGSGPEKEATAKEPPHLLDYEGLVQAAELIEQIKGEGETQKTTCQTEAGDYDGGQRKDETTSEVKS